MTPLFLSMKETLLIFAKAPIKGFAKTRLADDLGESEAIDLYKSFLETFFKRYNKQYPVVLAITPFNDDSVNYFQTLLNSFKIEGEIISQGEGDLFTRIKDVINERSDLELIHLTGSDIPDFPFERLDVFNKDEVVVGPDTDGGFYYMGFHRDNVEVLSNLSPEGGETVYSSLIRQIKSLGLKPTEIAPWSDVDTLEDYNNYLSRIK